MTSCERYGRIAKRMRELIAAGQVTPGEPVSEEAISEAEAELGYSLSPSFGWFLRDFGAAQFPAPQSNSDFTFGRFRVLAPGGPKNANLMDAVRSLRKGRGDLSPLPTNLYPFATWEVRQKRARIDLYEHLDSEEMDEEGEHRFTHFLKRPSTSKLTTSFLDWLEPLVLREREKQATPPDYETSAERLRSDACLDQYSYSTPASDAEIENVERALGFTFPEAYRRFVMEFGAADLGPDILPLAPAAEHSVLTVIRKLREERPSIPSSLIPFAQGGWRVAPLRYAPQYICFDRDRLADGGPLISDWTPKAVKAERLQHTSQTFLGWLDARAQWPGKHIEPPRDWRNNAGWDRYWTRTIAEDFCRNLEASMPGTALLRMVSELRERGVRRILFAGNGISMEPYAFAHLGFDVTALDVSSAASEFVETFAVAPEHLTRFLPACVPKWDPLFKADMNTFDEAESLKRVECEYVPGGHLSVVTADMFSFTPAAPFDVVYSRRSYQAFQHPERGILARMLAGCVRPGGVCVLETMNVSFEGYRAIDDEFEAAGFFIRGVETRRWYDDATRPGFTYLHRKHRADAQRAARTAAEAARELGRLARGEKVVIFCHGSG